MGKFESERKADLCTFSLIRLAKDKLRVAHRFYLLYQFQSIGIGCLDCCVLKESEAGAPTDQKSVLGSIGNVCRGYGMVNRATCGLVDDLSAGSNGRAQHTTQAHSSA